MNLSRRRFLSNSAKSALVVAACGVIEAKGGSVFVSSFAPVASQSAAVQPVFERLDEYIARHMRETGAHRRPPDASKLLPHPLPPHVHAVMSFNSRC